MVRETAVAESPRESDDEAMESSDHPDIRARSETPRFVVGTMTGTSIDGELDAALVKIEGTGLRMRVTVVATHSLPLGAIANDLRAIAAQTPLPAQEFARISRAFGELHALAIDELCSDAGVQPDLAVLHGQTVFHAPPLTWQLLDPWPVAVRLSCRVRYDLRSANVASGGQGAPITPLADFLLFARDDQPTIVVNLGGFVNATLLPRRAAGTSAIRGFDLCACNHLLDTVARARLGRPFDMDGAAAARGVCDEALAQRLAMAIAPRVEMGSTRRSLGTGDEAARLVAWTLNLSESDACRTIVEGIALAIAAALRDEPSGPIIIAGGSARNQALLVALAARSGRVVQTSLDAAGIAVGMREAVEMAILGALADDGVSYCLEAVTGCASLVPDSAVIEAPRHPRTAQV